MRKFWTIFLLWPIVFFGAGIYEMMKAKETADWPAIPAKITSFQILKDDEGGSYVHIEGKFIDTGEPFTVKRWAYGAVNGLSASQPYLAPYKSGYMTTVYVDPKDPNNVILCNNPSLTGNYMIMGGSATAVLAILWWLLLGCKKWEERQAKKQYVPSYSPIRPGQSKELPTWAGILIGILFSMVFLGIGVWSLYMAYIGRSPAAVFSHNDKIFMVLFGMMFSYGGIMALVTVGFGGKLPPILQRIMLSLFLFFLGLPFIVIPIIDPGGISSSSSINGHVINETKGSSVGAVVFMLVGIGSMIGALWPWRWWKKRY